MMKLLSGVLALFFALFFAPGPAFSLDFGLLGEQKIEAEKGSFSYSPVFTPWFSWDSGRGLSLYLSGALSLTYRRYDNGAGSGGGRSGGWEKPVILPELSRFAARYRPNQHVLVEAGRSAYTDTLGFAASGLFDGLHAEADFSFGRISAGAYYTGFIYWNGPGAYFASSRVLAALRWEAPLLEFHTLSVEALAQFDLNDSGGFQPDEARLHSQYGEIQAALFPAGRLGLNIGALVETMENGAGEFAAALGGLVRLKAELPGSLNDSLTTAVKFTSGNWNDTFAAFKPIISAAQGAVFTGPLSGLAVVSVDYAARFGRTLFLENALRYFARTWDDPAAPGALYGGELWGSLAWQPLDDLRLSLGGGAFFPGLGNIESSSDPDGKPLWKL
ncbi:MAG: hypothetical protein LBC62_10495, partial [Treponema sp.]|nr:hypothetical protein [Treponema sp.]